MCILSRRLWLMSLPASLTTDCGGLLNRRSPGRKRCCHTEALHAGYYVYFSHGLSRRSRSFHTSFLFVPNYRICELVYFHTENRGRSRGFVTNYRIFLHTESHGESRDLCHELSNCRISFHTEDHGGFLCHKTCSWSRICETCPWAH